MSTQIIDIVHNTVFLLTLEKLYFFIKIPILRIAVNYSSEKRSYFT